MNTAPVKEIESEALTEFCRRVTAIQAGGMIDIERVEPDGNREQIAEQATFQRVLLDQSGACSDRLTFEFGVGGQKTNAYIITEPIHVRLREAENGRYKCVEIVAEDGTTVLTFRPGINPAALQDAG
jgi:hypothetical protein